MGLFSDVINVATGGEMEAARVSFNKKADNYTEKI